MHSFFELCASSSSFLCTKIHSLSMGKEKIKDIVTPLKVYTPWMSYQYFADYKILTSNDQRNKCVY